MKISEAELKAYTREITKSQDSARIYVEASLRAFLQLNPNASKDDLYTFALQIMEQAFRAFGDTAAATAAAKYDETAKKLGYDLDAAENNNSWEQANLMSNAAYYAAQLSNGVFSPERFIYELSSLAYDHALHAANNTISSNADREADFRAGMRWARVPTGNETCGFCLMLASRGFSYKTREAAGGIYGSSINTYHAHCDCRVVPGDAFTTVDGYDPGHFYDVYSQAREQIEGTAQDEWNNMTEAEQKAYRSPGRGAYDKFLRNKIISQINKMPKSELFG